MQNVSGLDGYNKSNTALNTGKNESLAKSGLLTKASDKKSDETEKVGKTDRVTISPQAKRAMMKEALGLEPFWSVTKGDIEGIIGSDREVVLKKVEMAIEETGNSLDAEFQILDKGRDGVSIKGDLQNKEEFESMLNSDREFLFNYRRIAKNSKLIDRINHAPKELTQKSEKMISYLSDGNTVSDEALVEIGREYKASRESLKNPLEDLIKNTSNSGRFSLAYKSGAVM